MTANVFQVYHLGLMAIVLLVGNTPITKQSRIDPTSTGARTDEITVNEGTSPQEAHHSQYSGEWSTKQLIS